MHFAERVTVLAKASWIRSSDLFKSRIQRTDLPLERTGFSTGIFSFQSSSCKYWLKRGTAYFHMTVGKNPLIFSSTHLLVSCWFFTFFSLIIISAYCGGTLRILSSFFFFFWCVSHSYLSWWRGSTAPGREIGTTFTSAFY